MPRADPRSSDSLETLVLTVAASVAALAGIAHFVQPAATAPLLAGAAVLSGVSAIGVLVPVVAMILPLPLSVRLAVATAGGASWLLTRLLAVKARRLERRALRDGLTGLYRPELFRETLALELKRVHRDGGGVALVLFDLDDFKRINDGYGHSAGDDVLVAVARVISRNARSSDLVARYGGEEIALLVQGDARSAGIVAQRTLAQIELLTIRREIAVTASAGVADSQSFAAPAPLFEAADEALYEAKRRGKNRVVVAGRDGTTAFEVAHGRERVAAG